MEKIIEIDLNNKYDFVEKYNENKISRELIDYIIKQSIPTTKKEKIKIIINAKCDLDKDCVESLKKGLEEEYDRSMKEHKITDIKQICLLILGIVLLSLSTLIKEGVIWKEILLISGWVPIWEMVELELLSDANGKGKRRIIKKLLKSEIVKKEIKYDNNI